MFSLQFVDEHLSIGSLDTPEEFPDFVVLTGVNGSGKSHLLEAIANGKVQVLIDGDVTDVSDILLFTPADLNISNAGRGAASYLSTVAAISVAQTHLEEAKAQYLSEVRGTIGVVCPSFELTTFSDEELLAEDLIQVEDALVTAAAEAAGEVNDNQRVRNEQNARKNFQRGVNSASQSNTPKTQVLKNAVKVSKRRWQDIEAEHLSGKLLLLHEVDLFQQEFKEYFVSYRNALWANRYRRFLSSEGIESKGAHQSEVEFLNEHGRPPWELFNELVAEHGYSFSVSAPSDDVLDDYTPELTNTRTNAKIGFADLSSGESVFMSFLLATFHIGGDHGHRGTAKLLLLDEADAPLHPSLIADLISTIQTMLVKEAGIRVVLTTHSPTTVSLSPDEAIHEIAGQVIERRSRSEAVNVLSHGLPYLRVGNDPRIQVFVESSYDADRYGKLLGLLDRNGWFKAQMGVSFAHFFERGRGGCDSLYRLTKELTEGGATTIFGLVDSDDGRNSAEGHVLVLGEGKRYSSDTYFVDPLLIAVLCVLNENDWGAAVHPNRKSMGLEDSGREGGLKTGSPTSLQVAVDAVVKHVRDAKVRSYDDDPVDCELVNGEIVSVPKWWLEMNGKVLFDQVAGSLPGISEWSLEEYCEKVIEQVLAFDIGVLSSDIVDTFQAIDDLAVGDR